MATGLGNRDETGSAVLRYQPTTDADFVTGPAGSGRGGEQPLRLRRLPGMGHAHGRAMAAASNRLLWSALGCLSVSLVLSGEAAVTVEGLTSRTVYTDQVRFRVPPEPGTTDAATLNGQSVAVDDWVTVVLADYYDLVIRRKTTATGAVEERRFQFIVRDSTRGNSEWGLRPWTPPPVVNAAPEELAEARLRLLAPAAWPLGIEVPLVAWIETADGAPVRANACLSAPGFADLQLRRGVGAGLSPSSKEPGEQHWTPTYAELTGERTIRIEDSPQWTMVSGALASTTVWPADSRIAVTGDLTIPAGGELTIGAGSIVRLDPGVDILVHGTFTVSGTAERPVVFTPVNHAEPWGGITCRGDGVTLSLQHAILTGSGADDAWFDNNPGSGSSHRHEQPALYLGTGTRATLEDCCLIDNQGQAAHGEDAFLTLDHCLIQRCISVGQFNGGEVTVRRSALIEFPVDNDQFADDDNDAIYLTDGTHRITDTLIGWAKDDGIDSGSGGGGSVTVERCWIEACYHEGLAWSGANRITRTKDTVVLHCGQGIEAGWSDSDGSPDVLADHCLLLANSVGARFGDNYDWSYDGFLRVTNSFLLHNDRDVWGFNWDDWTYRSEQMDVQGNWLTAADPLQPDNAVFNWETDAPRLGDFLPSVERVGAGIAVPSGQATVEELGGGVPVGLSRWAAVPTSLRCEWWEGNRLLVASDLLLVPGRIAGWVPVPLFGTGEGPLLLRLRDTSTVHIAGRALLLVAPDAGNEITLVAQGSEWRYLDDGSDQGTAWREPGFDDSGWASGLAQLGYGDGDEVTAIDGGPSGARHATAYFRRAFEVADPARFETLELGVQRDDGAIVWLNGQEAFRTNMPEGEVAYDDYTGQTTSSESTFYATQVPEDLLVPGRNVLAVEVHQASATSSDLSFDLRLRGRLWPRLEWVAAAEGLVLYWSDPTWVLQTAPALDGPWTMAADASSPHLVAPEGSGFFRLTRP